jgi:hypothetical protein
VEPDGFVYDAGKEKLAKANGDRIDLAFVYTCRLVAKELDGLSLTLNKITFRTSFSDDSRERAGMFHAAIAQFGLQKAFLLNKLAPRLLTEELENDIYLRFPQFSPILQQWRGGGGVRWFGCSNEWGGTPSVYWDFVHSSLDLLSKQPGFASVSDEIGGGIAQKVQDLIILDPEPWCIPKAEDIEKLLAVTGTRPQIPWYHRQVNYNFSAASNAIRFLRSVRPNLIQHIREIILLEDRESVATPECHIKGLIPFCRANSTLRIHRIASLWTNILPVRKPVLYARDKQAQGDQLYARDITNSVARWMIEAASVCSPTEPDDPCTLTFDGDPIPEESSKAFGVVLRDAAWQIALDECYSRGSLPLPSWFERRDRVGYVYEDFPKILQELSASNCPSIRCNFVLRNSRSVESIIEECEGYTLNEWKEAWSSHSPTSFQTVPPLAPWHILRAGNVIPKGY